MMSWKTYIGDSVYAEFDGYGVILTTENGYPDDPRNKIYLEPEVFDSLVEWLKMIEKQEMEPKKE